MDIPEFSECMSTNTLNNNNNNNNIQLVFVMKTQSLLREMKWICESNVDKFHVSND